MVFRSSMRVLQLKKRLNNFLGVWICIHEYHNVPIQDFDLPKSRRLRRARGGLRRGFVTCAISLWCTNRSVPFGVRDFQHSCRAASLTDGLRAFGILGKRSALASGTGILGFGAATELIATPITIYMMYVYMISVDGTMWWSTSFRSEITKLPFYINLYGLLSSSYAPVVRCGVQPQQLLEPAATIAGYGYGFPTWEGSHPHVTCL